MTLQNAKTPTVELPAEGPWSITQGEIETIANGANEFDAKLARTLLGWEGDSIVTSALSDAEKLGRLWPAVSAERALAEEPDAELAAEREELEGATWDDLRADFARRSL